MKKSCSCFLFFCISLFYKSVCLANGGEALFKEFPNKYFIETGSYQGTGIQEALNTQCFEIIHSIEILKNYYDFVTDRFSENANVILWFGDSGIVLKEVLKSINSPATFWLDGHYACLPNTKSSPILQELEFIKNHPIKTHTILIDDVRDFGTYAFDFLQEKVIVKKLLEINPNYTIEHRDCAIARNDVLVAYLK